MLNALQLQPILNKKEQQLIASYNVRPYSRMYLESKENTLYDTAKALRKQNSLALSKYNKDDWETFKNLVINKPVEWSPAYELLSWIWSTAKINTLEAPIQKWTFLERQSEWLKTWMTSFIEDQIKPTLAWWLKIIPAVLDKPQKTITKWVTELWTVWAIGYYNAKELWKWIKKSLNWEWFSFDWNKASQDVEALQNRLHYTFWTAPWFWDYLNFNTMDENRKIMYNNSSNEEKKVLDKITPYTIIPDVVWWILTWLWTSKAITKVATKLWTTSVTGKILNALDQSLINPSLNNMAKIWAWVWAITIPYYWMTWKWLFEWDEQATIWAWMVWLPAVLKGLWIAWKAWINLVKNKAFQEWFSDFIEKYKTVAWNNLEELAQKQWVIQPIMPLKWWLQNIETVDFTKKTKTELKLIRNSLNRIYQSQAVKWGYSDDLEELKQAWITWFDNAKSKIKEEDIKFLKEQWVLKDWELDWWNKSFTFTKEALESKLIHTKGKWFHLPAQKPIIPDVLKQERSKSVVEERLNIMKEKASNEKIKEWKLEARIKDLWYWDDKKWKLWNYFSYIYERWLSKFSLRENTTLARQAWDTSVTWKLEKANKTAEKTIYMQQIFWKADYINNELQEISTSIWDDFEDFNTYLWAKSRWAKTVAENQNWRVLSTVTIWKDWKPQNWTADELKMAWTNNNRDWKYSQLAERVYSLNRQVQDLELDAWVLSKEELENYRKNPYYIPDKLEMDEYDKLISTWGFWKVLSKWKWLKWWSENTEFSIKAMENLAKALAVRTRVAMRAKQYNTILKLSEQWDYWIAKIVETKWWKAFAERWFDLVETFIDWERKTLQIPKYYKEFIEKWDKITQSTIIDILSIPTKITKFFATGKYNWFFQLKAPLYEVPFWILKNWSNEWNTVDYLKSLTTNILWDIWIKSKDALLATPEWKRALLWLMKFVWADFSKVDQFSKEFNNFLVKEEWSLVIWKAWGALKRADDFAGWLWHKIEMSTTRIPLFESQLKKYWLTWEKFLKIVKANTFEDWDMDILKIKKVLEKQWVNVEEAWYITRNLFDYWIASKKINSISRCIPYLNTAVSSITSLKNVFEDNPRKFLLYMAGITWIWEAMYEYNYSWERWDALRKQNPYVRTKVWLVSVDDEAGKINIFDIWHNIQMLEWIYPMIIAMHENWDYADAFNRVYKDLTYFWDLQKPLWIDLWKAPPIARQLLELYNNKDYFYNRDLIPDWAKKEDTTEDYDKYTNPLYIKFAKAIAILSWAKERQDWFLEWGYQMSPKRIEKLFEIVDPMWTTADTIAMLFQNITDVWVTKSNVKWLNKAFHKTFQMQDLDVTNEEVKKITVWNAFKLSNRSRIETELKTATNINELVEKWKWLIKKYKELPEYEEIYKEMIKEKVKEREQQIKFWMKLYYDYKKTASDLAKTMYVLETKWWLDAVKERVNQLRKMWMSQNKIDEIKVEFLKIKNELKKED